MSNIHRSESARPESKLLSRPRIMEEKMRSKTLSPTVHRDPQFIDIEAALSPFWAWRLTYH